MVWTPRTTVAAVIENEGRFLLIEEESELHTQNVFNQPAGHLEAGESLIDAVIRETLEESGYDFLPTFLTGIYRWIEPNSGNTYLRFSFTGKLGQHHPDLPLDTGIIGPRWLTYDEIINLEGSLRSPLVKHCINDYLAGQRFPLHLLADI